MSPILDTKRAAEKRLKALFPSIPIAYEGISFTPPTTSMYIRGQFAIRPPDDPVLGSRYYRERISFQVFVVDVANKGTAASFETAETIRSSFYKSLTLTENNTKIHIWETPHVVGTDVVENKLVTPVLIELVAEVYKD